MNKQTAKLTIREIKGSFGRYMAIFAIIALGAGLFVGLRMSKPDFIKTYDRYLHETNFYNFRLVSTLGLTQDDVDEVLKLDGVKDAEGVVSADFLYNQGDDKSIVIAAQEIPEKINLIDLKAGRMPQRVMSALPTQKCIPRTISAKPLSFQSKTQSRQWIPSLTTSIQ